MKEQTTHRRGFITTLLGGAAAFGLSAVISPLKVQAENTSLASGANEAENWFAQMEGKKHKMVFDVTKHNNGGALNWALTLMDSYNELGVPDNDLSIVLVLRYAGTPLALADPLWEKYEFGKLIELKDSETKENSLRNIFSKCQKDDDNCFEKFQKRGGLICVCSKAIEHRAEKIADNLKLDKETVKKEFLANVLPGIQLMPSGIWAVNRAQELGCKFSFGG